MENTEGNLYNGTTPFRERKERRKEKERSDRRYSDMRRLVSIK